MAAPTTMSSWPPVHASGTAALGEGLGVAARLAEGVGVGVGAVVLVVGTDGATGLAEIVGVARCPEPAPPESFRRTRVAPPHEEDGHEHHGDDLPPHRVR